jgi:hypothetical protein
VAFENRTHFIFSRGEWQIANVDRRHSTNLTDRGFNIQTPAQVLSTEVCTIGRTLNSIRQTA